MCGSWCSLRRSQYVQHLSVRRELQLHTPSLLLARQAAAGLTGVNLLECYTDFLLVNCKIYLKINIAVS